MDPDVQAFKDAMAEKAAAKTKVMSAVATGHWKVVEEHGINGAEGKAMAEAQKIADDYVKSHPDQFVNVETYVTPDGQEKIVALIDIFSKAGMEEEVLKLTMFELAKFERQEIGVATRGKVRLGNGE